MFAVNKLNFFWLMMCAFIGSGCALLTNELLQNPEVQLSQVEVTGISLKDISMNLKLKIKNPNISNS